MTAPDLLPCPFCGGEASAWNLTLEGAVHCADCRATIVRQHKPVYDTGYEEAIAAWNTRATPAAMTPDPAAIREAWEKTYWRMRSYAVHDNDCKLNKPPRFDGPCSCGLTAALEEALALITEKPHDRA